MIQKMLNKYYKNLVIEILKNFFIMWSYDVKYEYDEKKLQIYIKHHKFNDEQYCNIMDISNEYFIKSLANPDLLKEELIKRMDMYREDHKVC